MQPEEARKGKALRYAIYATVFTCAGTFFVIMAPGDGQTGGCTFPLWIIGLVYVLLSIGNSGFKGEDRWPIFGLTLLCLVSIICAFLACMYYTPSQAMQFKLDSNESASSSNK